MKPRSFCGGGWLGRLLVLTVLLSVLVAGGESFVINVPAYRQVKNGCGSAVLAMVLDYWKQQGVPFSAEASNQEAIHQKLYLPAEGGVPAHALVRYLQGAGFHAFAVHGTRGDLGTHLRKGRPLIVCLRQGRRRHYVVVRGLDDEAVWVNDPATGSSRRMDWDSFAQAWTGAHNWILLAAPRQSSAD